MRRWITGSCKANGIHIHYLRTGKENPPVVLLHGLTANGACWVPLARALEAEYDVIMPDARGHGRSAAPDSGYSYDNLADDVLNLIDFLGLEAPVLIGHSMGGMTAAIAASKNPKRLRGLVLADPTFLTPERQREVYESDVQTQHRRILSQPKDDYLAELRNRHSRRLPELVELLGEARFQTSIQAFEILTPRTPDYMELIKRLDIPSLLLIGGAGSIVSVAMAEELARLNPCFSVVQISESGHGMPYDQPERFAAIVYRFLKTHHLLRIPVIKSLS